jgi:hypothetical protein
MSSGLDSTVARDMIADEAVVGFLARQGAQHEFPKVRKKLLSAEPPVVGRALGPQPGAQAGRHAVERLGMMICSSFENWRELALFFDGPERHFSTLHSHRQIATL